MATKGAKKAAPKGAAAKAKPLARAAAKVKKVVAGAAPAAKRALRRKGPAVAGRTAHPSAGNVGVACTPRRDGATVVVVAYEGPLAAREQVAARAGALRQGGSPWAETMEVELEPAGEGRWVGTLTLPPGEPVDAVQLVFRAGDDWDNGGRAPLGYYEWVVALETLDVR
jgi:hypothetical protein